MKKIYSLIALAAIAISANAEGRQKAVNEPVVVKGPTATAVISLEGKKTTTGARATAKDFEGSYTLTGYKLTSGGGNYSLELTITLDNALSNDVTISGFPQGFEVKGTIDPDEETLSIANNQELGTDNAGDMNYFYFKSINSDYEIEDGASSIDESVATYYDGTFTFPTLEIWAIGDPNQEELGWWLLGYGMTMTYIDPNADPNEGWDDYGTATFTDGWIVSGYVDNDGNAIVPSDYPWTVNIQKSQTNDNLYRVNCPYQAEECPIDENGAGYYVFSLEDPEYVIVYPGVASGAMYGTEPIRGFNMEGFYLSQGYDKAVIQQANVLSNYSNYNEAEGIVTIYNCRFNMPSSEDKAYTWQTSEGESLVDNMVSTITFNNDSNGIEDIITDKTDINAPAEYYNIQGMKVKNPTPGSIYIVRKGGKVSKMLVK